MMLQVIGKVVGLSGVISVFLGMVMTVMPQDAQAEHGDIVLNRYAENGGMRPVIFPHWFHRIRFQCRVCHAELGFEMRAGANDVKMLDIVDGKFCGHCHNNQVAWGPMNCDLCHSGKRGLKGGVYPTEVTGGPGKW